MLYTIVPRTHVHPEMDRFIAASTLHSAKFAWGLMRTAKRLQFCFVPGFPESVRSSYSGCCIVAYSSNECQKRAWTDEELPNRDIVRAMKRAKIRDLMLKEIGMWLYAIFRNLQRTGPIWTTDARQHAEQKEGPIFPAGALDYISELQSSFLPIPERRRARG